MQLNRRMILPGLAAAGFIGPFTQTVYVPSLVQIAQQFGVGTILVNLTISLFVGILAVSGFFIGPLTDRYGRRRLLLPGLGLFILGSLLCLFAPGYWWFLVGRAVQALGVSISLIVAATVIADLYAPNERGAALSIYQLMAYLGPVMGPVAGGLIAEYQSWQWAFALLAGAGGVVLLYNAWVLPETLPVETVPTPLSRRALADAFAHRAASAIMLIAFSQFYGYYSFLVFLPQLLDKHFELSAAARGFAFVPLTAGLLLGSLAARFLSGRVADARLITLAAYLVACDVLALWCLLLAGQLSFPLLPLLMLLYGATLGISLPAQTAMLVNLFTQSRATVVGVFNSVRFFGAAAGPLLGGAIAYCVGLPQAFLALGLLLLGAAWVGKRQLRAR